MNGAIVWVIFCKELLDTLRDKRTLIAMIGVPILLYPTLALVLGELAVSQSAKVASEKSRVAIVAEDADAISRWFDDREKIELTLAENPDDALARGEIDAIVRSSGSISDTLTGQGTLTIEIEYDTTETASRNAADRVEEVLRKREKTFLKERLASASLPDSFANPIRIKFEAVEEKTKRAGFLLGSLIPGIVVLMMTLGGFYPAVDLTAGEKERGTFETLLSTPASKLDILAGKFGVVLVLSLITGLLNVLSSGLTLWIYLIQLAELFDRDSTELVFLSIPPIRIALMALLLLPLAFIVSALMMTVAVFARSFKDAQNYVTPLFVAITIPALIGTLPDFELTAGTRLIPIGNVMLLVRDVMMDQAGIEDVFVVLLSTLVYGLGAFLLAVSVFQSENVILSQERGMPFTLNRSLFGRHDTPTPGLALGIFATVMVMVMYFGSLSQAYFRHAGLALTEYGLVLLPVLAILWYCRIRWSTALNLRGAPGLFWLGCVLAAAGWIVLSIQIGIVNARFLPPPPEIEKMLLELMAPGETLPGLLLLLLLIGVTPAICEEALFRGALLSGLRGVIPNWAVVLAIGALFGMFHLTIYRFVPTAATGLVLTYIALRGNSILLSGLFHALFNSALVLLELGYLPAEFLQLDPESTTGGTGLPISVIVSAAVVFAAGIGTVEMTARRRGAD